MDASKAKKGKLTPADLASYGILPNSPKEPKLAKGPEPKTQDRPAPVSEASPWQQQDE